MEFKLNYAITASDIKAVNKKIFLFYFLLYLSVSIIGIAVGIVAVVLNPTTVVLVLGILILVFSAILAAVSVLMAIAPKNFVVGIVPVGDEPMDITIDKHGVTVGGQNVLAFADMQKIKKYKDFFTVADKANGIFIVKNAIVSGQSYDELYSYMSDCLGKLLLVPTEQTKPADTDGASEQTDTAETEEASEQTDTAPSDSADGELNK